MAYITTTKAKILHYIQNNFPVTANTLDLVIPVSRQMIHRHLGDLVKSGHIYKQGRAPKIYYYPQNPAKGDQKDRRIAWLKK
jgi:predicted HTH transcriptional regulator